MVLLLFIPQYHSQSKRLLLSESDDDVAQSLSYADGELRISGGNTIDISDVCADKIAQLQTQIDSLTATISILTATVSEDGDKIEKIQPQIDMLTETISADGDKIEKFQPQIDMLTETISEDGEKIEKFQSQINILTETISEDGDKIVEFQSQIDMLTETINEDGDKDDTNELQTLNFDGSMLSISGVNAVVDLSCIQCSTFCASVMSCAGTSENFI